MGTDGTTGRRLRLLQQELTELPNRGDFGQRRGPTPVPVPAPLNLALLDYITASVTEVTTHVRAAAPAAGPAPARVDRIYDWWRQNTPELDENARLVREAVIYRQGLEHAIQAGDTDVVCKHPCPGCGCWGLVWSKSRRHAACLNRDCTDQDGVGSSWRLKDLAYEHIARREKISASSAT